MNDLPELNLPARDPDARPGPYRPRFCTALGDARSFGHEALDHGLFDVFPEEDMSTDEGGKAEYNAGVHAYSAGDIDAATASFTLAIQLAPGAIAARNNLAICLLQRGDREAGLHQLRTALVDDPDDPHLLRNLGVALSMADERDEALAILRRACENAPEDPELLFLQSTILDRNGQTEEAVECMKRAAEIDPDSCSVFDNLGIVLHRADRLDEAIEAFERARELDPEHPLPHYNVARAYAAAGRLRDAEESFRRHLELEPEHSCAIYDLARVLSDMDQESEALERMLAYVEMEERDPRGQCSLGVQYLRAGRAEEAEAPLRRSLELDPFQDWAVHVLGRRAMDMGDPRLAEAYFREALARDPSLGDARRSLLEAIRARSGIDAAVAELRENPHEEDAGNWFDLVNELYNTEQREQGRELGAEMAGRYPALPWIRGLYALTLDAAGLRDEALRELREVLRLDPEDRIAQYHTARIFADMERYEQAIPPLEFVLRFEPESLDCRRLLAYCLGSLGREEEALAEVRRILEIDPEDEFAKDVIQPPDEEDDPDSEGEDQAARPDVDPDRPSTSQS